MKLSGCRIVKAEPYARCRRKTPLGLRAKRFSRSNNDFFSELSFSVLTKRFLRGVWEAEVVRLLEPVQEDSDDAPYYPLLPVIVNQESEYLLPASMVKDAEHNPEEFIQEYIDAWMRQGIYPKEIRCRDQRTYAMFLKGMRHFCRMPSCIIMADDLR